MNNNTPNNTTEIAFILDRSGSMQSIAEAAVSSFNELLERQKKEHEQTPVRISLVLFNTEYEVPFSSVMASELPRLDMKTYAPDGGTALLDAIGRTIDELGSRLAAMSEADRPGKVIVAIMTDGEENSSRQFNWEQISEKIKHQTEVYKWEFLFLGANQDAIATGSRMHISAEGSTNYFQQDGSARTVLRAMSSSVRFSKERRLDAKPSLSALVAEEEAKDQSGK
jgi:uncharacterized protein YegL